MQFLNQSIQGYRDETGRWRTRKLTEAEAAQLRAECAEFEASGQLQYRFFKFKRGASGEPPAPPPESK